jgi:hypothetical protein
LITGYIAIHVVIMGDSGISAKHPLCDSDYLKPDLPDPATKLPLCPG